MGSSMEKKSLKSSGGRTLGVKTEGLGGISVAETFRPQQSPHGLPWVRTKPPWLEAKIKV